MVFEWAGREVEGGGDPKLRRQGKHLAVRFYSDARARIMRLWVCVGAYLYDYICALFVYTPAHARFLCASVSVRVLMQRMTHVRVTCACPRSRICALVGQGRDLKWQYGRPRRVPSATFGPWTRSRPTCSSSTALHFPASPAARCPSPPPKTT